MNCGVKFLFCSAKSIIRASNLCICEIAAFNVLDLDALSTLASDANSCNSKAKSLRRRLSASLCLRTRSRNYKFTSKRCMLVLSKLKPKITGIATSMYGRTPIYLLFSAVLSLLHPCHDVEAMSKNNDNENKFNDNMF